MSNHYRADFSVVLPAKRSDIFFFNTRVYNVRQVSDHDAESEVASLWCALIDHSNIALGAMDGPDAPP